VNYLFWELHSEVESDAKYRETPWGVGEIAEKLGGSTLVLRPREKRGL